MGKIRKLVPSTKVVIEFTFLIFQFFACIIEAKKREYEYKQLIKGGSQKYVYRKNRKRN